DFSGDVSVLLGDGTGKFTIAGFFSASGIPQSVAIGDFTGDGKPDLAVSISASEGSSSVALLAGTGNGKFAVPQNYTLTVGPGLLSARQLLSLDFNGDG